MNRRRGVAFSKGTAKNRKYTLKRLWNYLSKFKYLLIIALILTITSNILALLGPSLTGKIMDEIELGEGNINFRNIYYFAILMGIFYISSCILTYIISLVMITISKKCVYTMRKDAFNKMLSLPISFFDRNQIGDIISRLSYDVDTVNTSLSTDLVQIITSAITIVGSFVMMIITSPLLVLIFVVTLPISLLFTRIMIKKTSKYFKARSHNLGLLSGFNEEMITSCKTIKAYGREEEIINNFNKFNEEAAHATYMAEYYSAYTGPGVNFVNNLSLSLICLFGAILMKNNLITIGNISSFVLYSKSYPLQTSIPAHLLIEPLVIFSSSKCVYKYSSLTKFGNALFCFSHEFLNTWINTECNFRKSENWILSREYVYPSYQSSAFKMEC